jgi:hypothetical protein
MGGISKYFGNSAVWEDSRSTTSAWRCGLLRRSCAANSGLFYLWVESRLRLLATDPCVGPETLKSRAGRDGGLLGVTLFRLAMIVTL